MPQSLRRVILFFAVCAAAGSAPAAAPVDGALTVDGKTINIRYAYAVSGPDTFDGTKQAFLLLLTDKALPAGAVRDAESFNDLGSKSMRALLQNGLLLVIGQDRHIHMTVRHPALKDHEIQESGPG